MNYLSLDFIVYLNRMTSKENGGLFVPPHNFLHGEQLTYIIEAVDATMFGEELYPTVADKAALYMYNIVCNHVFADGNKRTGLTAAIAFLRKNNYRLIEQLFDIDGNDYGVGKQRALELFTLAVASGEITFEETKAWFAANIAEEPTFTPPKNPE